jgi:hypothetical protein
MFSCFAGSLMDAFFAALIMLGQVAKIDQGERL